MYILNDHWSFISSKTFSGPVYMITDEKSLSMTRQLNLWKFANSNKLLGKEKYFSLIIFNNNQLLYEKYRNTLKIISIELIETGSV